MNVAPAIFRFGPAAGRSIAIALCWLVGSPATAAPAPATISVPTLKEVTQTLSSDAFEGRAPVTPAEDKTIAFVARRFAQAGLAPGNGSSWFQDVPLVEITAQAVSPLTITGGTTPIALDYRRDMVVATYRVTPHIAIRDSEMVFVGYGIDAPERGWNDYAGVDVRGKTVIILVNDPDWRSPDRTGPFEGRAMTYYGRWTYKYEEAARHGAAAAIIVHDTEPAAYGWGVVQSSWTGAQRELDEPGDHLDQSAAIGWIQQEAAVRVIASAGMELSRLSAAAAQRGFKAVPLGLKASLSFDNAIRRQASHNVIGVLRGTRAPDETVFYTAHWDHLGRCDAVAGDGICNGAADNASGVAGLVALAEAQARAGPAARTMVFLAVTAEESGLLGSRYYAEHPIYPIARTVGGINMDVLALDGASRDFVVTGAGKSDLDAMIVPLVRAQGRVIAAEPNPERGSYFRSDHFSFARAGVPMLDARSGEDLVVGGTAAGHAATLDYIAHRYHKPQDEYNPAWNWDGAVMDLELYARLGRQLADGGTWPEWLPTAEFGRIRDATRASRPPGAR